MSEPIPDILTDLRSGRYPHDFIQAITGPIGENWQRARCLEDLLGQDRGPEALTALLLVGARSMLKHFEGAATEATIRAVRRLADADERELNLLAITPAELFRRTD